MQIFLPLYVSAFVLFLLFVVIWYKARSGSPITLGHFGARKVPGFSDKQRELVLGHTIFHRNMAYYAYLAALVVSFSLGVIAIYKITQNALSWSLLKDAFAISSGTSATIGLRKLYLKCDKDILNLLS